MLKMESSCGHYDQLPVKSMIYNIPTFSRELHLHQKGPK